MKVRIYTLAKELGLDSKEILELLDSLGVTYKSVSSTLDEETVETIKELVQTDKKSKETKEIETEKEPKIEEKPKETAKLTETEPKKNNKTTKVEAEKQEKAKEIPHRPPVVVIMGHVDHGKTSLLDFIRKSRIAEKEAGGITQHIGAFDVATKHGKIVFIDTPGHEAFTNIRARGAKVADIAVIVIAADDGIMPQTREAIAHARAAKLPIVAAINKVDVAGSNIDRVKQQMLAENLVPEEYGGDIVTVAISAKSGENVPDLLENLSLVAELEDLRADPQGEFKGVIIEARIDKQAGVLATVLVQEGTLKVSDFLVSGEIYGKIRAMTDSNGERAFEAQPGTAVQILGFSQTPQAGEMVSRAKNEHDAREIAESHKQANQTPTAGISIDNLFSSDKREIELILRADTQGSLEAIQGILERESNEDVKITILFAGIGAPTEGDVLLASASNALILGFAVTAPGNVKKLAELKKIEIKTYRIIYEMIDEVKKLIRGTAEPVFEDRYLGKAEVRMVIRVPKAGGNIAGSYILDGKILRNAKAKLLRRQKEIYKGSVSGLKRFKDDVREVAAGYECGINLAGFDAFEEGDVIEVWETVEVSQTV